jgi:hypothetical protein
MSDAISELDGYQHTRSWFAEAVPSRGKYIEFTDHPVRKIRLRLMSPNHHLCLSHKRGSNDPDFSVPPNYYLGHMPLATVMPMDMISMDTSETWGDIKLPGPNPDLLFRPGRYGHLHHLKCHLY